MSGPAATRPCGGEQGAFTVLFVALVAIGCLFIVSAGRLGAALTARARAETAADAAALAAADSLAVGTGDATEQAERIAHAQGARLLSCVCRGTAAEVVVEIDAPIAASLPHPARARARAEVDYGCPIRACPDRRSSPRGSP